MDIHVPESKIVWPYFFTFNERRNNYDIIGNFVKSVLRFDGLIIGNSYALRGIIDDVKFARGIKGYDLFNHDMSNNNIYWADETHLNSIGAEFFTKMIDEYMKVKFYDE